MANDYLQKQREKMKVAVQMEKQTIVKFMLEMMIITLSDSDVMEGDAFGVKRLSRVVTGLVDNYKKFEPALFADNESDYLRYKLDEILKEYYGIEFTEFEKRYPFVKKIKY